MKRLGYFSFFILIFNFFVGLNAFAQSDTCNDPRVDQRVTYNGSTVCICREGSQGCGGLPESDCSGLGARSSWNSSGQAVVPSVVLQANGVAPTGKICIYGRNKNKTAWGPAGTYVAMVITKPTSCVDSGKGNIQITSTSITNYPGLTATSPYYGKVTVNYKNIGGTFCKAPVFSFFYKGIFSNAISNGGPASTLTTTLANQTGTITWQFGREQTGVDCKTTRGPKNAQIEIGITPTTSSHLTLPVTVNCP